MTTVHIINENGIEGKICIGFKSERHWCPLSEFTTDRSKKDNLRNQCNSCVRKYITTDGKSSRNLTNKRYRQSEKGRLTTLRNQKRYNKMRDELKSNGCAICGYNKCPAALTFHHVNPNDKKFNIEIRSFGFNDDVLVEEINKCIILCENCHRELHYNERHPK